MEVVKLDERLGGRYQLHRGGPAPCVGASRAACVCVVTGAVVCAGTDSRARDMFEFLKLEILKGDIYKEVSAAAFSLALLAVCCWLCAHLRVRVQEGPRGRR